MLQQLNRVASKINLTISENGDDVWFCCPFHREDSPSLILNLNSNKGFKPGSWHCFGCGKNFEPNTWNHVAHILKLKPYKAKPGDEFALDVSQRLHQEIYSSAEDEKLNPNEGEINLAPLWDSKSTWRGIKGSLINKLGGRQIINKYGERLYIPVTVYGKAVGGITCALTKFAKRKYIYDSGKWINETLFPYDYVRKRVRKLRRQKKRVVIFLVEGPRDALNLLQHGLLALAILGGKTVWRDTKAEAVLLLEPDLVVLAFDPDEIGDAVTELAKVTLSKQVPLKRLNFSNRRVKRDAGNMKRSRINRIKRALKL